MTFGICSNHCSFLNQLLLGNTEPRRGKSICFKIHVNTSKLNHDAIRHTDTTWVMCAYACFQLTTYWTIKSLSEEQLSKISALREEMQKLKDQLWDVSQSFRCLSKVKEEQSQIISDQVKLSLPELCGKLYFLQYVLWRNSLFMSEYSM